MDVNITPFWEQQIAIIRERMDSISPSDWHKNFLQWPTIHATMFVGNAPYTAKEFELAEEWFKKTGRADVWDKLAEPESVNVPEFYRGRLTGNAIHGCYHMAQFEQHAGLDVRNIGGVLEFGAGYGMLARVLRAMGHAAPIHIYDLEPMRKLQERYLRACAVSDVYWLTGADELTRYAGADDLFISLWALSESPLAVQQRVCASLATRAVIFAHADNLQVNNDTYAGIGDRYACQAVTVPHVNSSYLFGVIKGGTAD